jgi:hypothetical protein
MPIIGGNRWNDWVREFAKKNNTTYGCAISMPECKEGYKKAYPKPVKGKRGRPKKKAVVDDDFGLAPENISMSIEELPPPDPKELASMAGEDKNVSKDRIDDLMDMWDKILDNNDKTPIKTQGAYVKRLQKPIARPLTQYYEDKKMSKPQKKRYNALWKRSNAMYENLPKAKDLKKKREEAKNTPYDPLEEAKPTTEPVSKGISIKKKVIPTPEPAPAPVTAKPKSSEVASLARQAKSNLFGEGVTPETAKKFARPLVTKLVGYYNANLLNKIDDKLVQAIVKKYNEITKESVMLGHGRINRIRLKRNRGDKGNHSYAPDDEEGGSLLTDFTNKVQAFKKGVADTGTKIQQGITDTQQKAQDVAQQTVSAITPTPVKEAINKVAEQFWGDDLPNNVKATLKKYGDQPITGLTIGRTPVPRYITDALNVVSLGEWKKKFASKPYDTLYHLFLIIRTSGGQFLIEKNERINTSTTIPKNTETSVVSGNFGGLTPNILLEKTKALMGDQFLSYSAFNNNCQHFITSILKANHLGSPADYAFVKQDTESLFENSPQTKKFADTLTDLGARVSKITGRGRGRPRKGGAVPLKVAEMLNPEFANHPALYQNPILQHVGAVSQKGIPWGIGANAGGYETDSSTSSSSSSSSSDSDMEGRGNPYSKIATTYTVPPITAPASGATEEEKTKKANKWIKRTTFRVKGAIKYADAEIKRFQENPNASRTDDDEFQTLLVTKHRAEKFLAMPYREKRAVALRDMERQDAKRRGDLPATVMAQPDDLLAWTEEPPAEPDGTGGSRNPELKRELRNYNDILGHLSSHLLSSEKQDPKDLTGALRYARELVRVLEKWSMTGQGKPSKVYTETDEGQPSSCLPFFKNTVHTDSNFSSIAPDPSGLRTGDIQHPNRVPRDEDAINRLADANRKFRNRVAPLKS